jgi:predicted ATPase/DNA-binding SARP family transcriptional activator
MEFQILGPLRVVGPNGPIELSAALERALLLRLLIDANRPVSVDQLIDDLWASSPPPTAVRTLRVYVSRLRKAMVEPDRIQTTDHGYRLTLRPHESDAHRFDALLAAGEIDAALGLWSGPALADVAEAGWARIAAVRLEDSRLSALERRFQAELDAGRHRAIIGELEAICAQEPFREVFWASLMVALYRAGRQVDALVAYTSVRTRLVEELGLEPGPELRALQRRILAGDPELSPPTIPAQPASRDAPSPSRETPSPSRPARSAFGNVMPPRTSFVAGSLDIARLRAELADSPGLVTLVGPPGAGKTRNALELAVSAESDFPGGTWLLELAAIRDPDALPGRLLNVLGVDAKAGSDALDQIAERLGADRTLIIVDNCEHLMRPSAALVGRLLALAPGLVVVATSRERLGLDVEVVHAVEPLASPAADAGVEEIHAAPACRLFLERAAVVGGAPDLSDPAESEALAAICRGLDGLPLALELAASRSNILGVIDIAARLDDALGLLRSRRGQLPERQRTLRALLEWSDSLLDEDERTLLRRLAVFTGGATLNAVEAVCGHPPLDPADCLDALQSLVERSLVVVETTRGQARYRLLETIRVYALERLREAGEEEMLLERHVEWCIRYANEAESLWMGGEQATAGAMFVAEQDNWAAALRRLLRGADGPRATALAAPLGQWWYVSGRTAEGRAMLEAVIALSARPSRERATVLRLAGALARTSGDFSAARHHIRDGIAVADAIGDRLALLQLQISLGAATWLSGDADVARVILTEALATALTLGDRRAVGNLRYNLAVMARNADEPEEALSQLEAAGDAWRDVGDERGQAIVHGLAASVLLRAGDHAEACRRVTQSLQLLHGTPYLEATIEQLETVALIDALHGDPRRAARLIGHADAIRATERMLRPPIDDEDIRRTLGSVRSTLGDETDAELLLGSRLSTAQALELALAALGALAESAASAATSRQAAMGMP